MREKPIERDTGVLANEPHLAGSSIDAPQTSGCGNNAVCLPAYADVKVLMDGGGRRGVDEVLGWSSGTC